jgi:hypothetical protein
MSGAEHPAAAAFDGDADGQNRKRVTAEHVVSALRRSGMLLTRHMDGTAYIAFKGDRFSRHRLRSISADHLIRHIYKLHCRNAAREDAGDEPQDDAVLSRTVVQNVLAHLEAEAANERQKMQHFTRVGAHKGACCIDLGQAGYRIALVTAKIFKPSIVDADIPFVRPPGMRPMPTPRKMPGVMADLRDLWANLSDDDFKLVVLFMLSCLWLFGRWAVLVIWGTEGSWKSSLARMIRYIVDPHELEVASLPEWPRDMVTAGHNSRLVVWDNVSSLSNEQSDALCKRSDGVTSAYVTKYTDADLTILRSDGPTILTTIPSLVARPDLARRGLFVSAERQPGKHSYRDMAEVERRIKEIAPGVLYELLDAIRVGLAGLGHVRPVPEFSLPDFSRLAQAAAPAFGWTAEQIGGLLSAHIGRQRAVVADNSPLVLAMMDWLATLREEENGLAFEDADRGCWTGTLTALLNKLNSVLPTGRWNKEWPVHTAALGSELKRLELVLKQCGIVVEKLKRGRGQWERRVRVRCLSAEPMDGETWSDRMREGADWKSDADTLH